jgi:unsaturated rhamnogalacturonyl hydrolase
MGLCRPGASAGADAAGLSFTPQVHRPVQRDGRRAFVLQGPDGLWRPGLLDAAAYALPENSDSAFYAYGFAYGINSGILNRAKYQPVVQKAWMGLLSHIYEDGRLGCIQPIGAAPGDFTAASSYVFGTGAFLLAGSEVYRLAR